jgi:hypothetical protein
MQNGRALRDAPLVFVASLLIAFGLAYWLVGIRYQGVLDQKTGTIENLKTEIDGLRGQLAARPQPPLNQTPLRDPDGIYQLGAQVGSVQSPQVDETRGMVTFNAIVAATRLNADRDFEYRDFVLHIKSLGAETRSSVSGQINRALHQVVCEIVGRVSH